MLSHVENTKTCNRNTNTNTNTNTCWWLNIGFDAAIKQSVIVNPPSVPGQLSLGLQWGVVTKNYKIVSPQNGKREKRLFWEFVQVSVYHGTIVCVCVCVYVCVCVSFGDILDFSTSIICVILHTIHSLNLCTVYNFILFSNYAVLCPWRKMTNIRYGLSGWRLLRCNHWEKSDRIGGFWSR